LKDKDGKLVNEGKSMQDFIAAKHPAAADMAWALPLEGNLSAQWTEVKEHGSNDAAVAEFKSLDKPEYNWDQQKIEWYNHHLSGKLVIPQPFGELRNLYQAQSGFCISKFMVIELAVALIMLLVFSWVARKLASGQTPKGRLLNLMETFLVFIRDQIAAPSLGGGHAEHHDDGHGHAHVSAEAHGPDITHVESTEEMAQHAYEHIHRSKEEISDERMFTPVLWTIFFFVLGCNLFGIAPWAGAPTAAFNVTLALAAVTFLAVFIGGSRKFGVLGFFANQVPTMDLPLVLAIFLKPMIFAIEIVGLMIKHGVLAIRLLANMVAGHLVILGIMGLAFGVYAALNFTAPDVPSWQWPLVATIAVVGSTLFSILELFVAFLQAYIFTFLSALFIGAAVHKH
jgi:F-type H+-transporting ATPase subunit a